MGMYDSFNFDKNFSFNNIIIPKGYYQTKDLENCLDSFRINNDIIELNTFHHIEHKEYPELDSKRWERINDGYKPYIFSGEIVIYSADYDNNNNNYFKIEVQDGKIINLKQLK